MSVFEDAEGGLQKAFIRVADVPSKHAKTTLLRSNEDRIEDREWLGELIRITALHVPLPKVKVKKKLK